MTQRNRFASVWDAIEDTPRQATRMKARSALMMELAAVIAPVVKVPKPRSTGKRHATGRKVAETA